MCRLQLLYWYNIVCTYSRKKKLLMTLIAFSPKTDEIKTENNETSLSRETIYFPFTVHTSCNAGFPFLHLFLSSWYISQSFKPCLQWSHVTRDFPGCIMSSVLPLKYRCPCRCSLYLLPKEHHLFPVRMMVDMANNMDLINLMNIYIEIWWVRQAVELATDCLSACQVGE